MNAALLKTVAAELAELAKAQDVPEGLHSINARVIIDVTGSVVQGAQVEYTPTVDLPMLDILALVAKKAGFQGPRLLEVIQEATTEALEQGEKVGDYIESTKAGLRLVRDMLTRKLPKKHKNGALRRAVAVKVDMQPL